MRLVSSPEEMGVQSDRLSTFIAVVCKLPVSKGFASMFITDFCLLNRPTRPFDIAE